ncbi:ANTAR domain-containing protein [Streptomyces sp. ISL-12]|uniref:GAF and ANTAR domain-containing protein n=1 Tax=Streptomyces sp. ISL-12 TaxID=2819177 RepID=UPI001BE8B7D5|nr:ANTAR domain-containing protein [Streptomyces sp. ISL-12]MBT2409862.1 ANTAR domain-containing protein [Streptomyces sp. ISL-12]
MGQLPWHPDEGITPATPSGSRPVQWDPRWAQEELDLRNRGLGHAGVGRAQNVLAKRYHLASADQAFELLRTVSQQSNIKLHTLADAVVRTPAPDQDAPLWFPGRARVSPPRLPGLSLDRGSRGSQGAVLKAALHRVLSITQTPMGNVQLAESGRLHLARHTGLNTYFTDFFAFVDAPTTACSQAAAERRQVTVRDVATADVFDEASRFAILQAGSRAAHSVPLTNGKGGVLGMVSSHHERPLAGFTSAQLHALQQTGTDVGRWLSWHWHTVVLDALERLHAQAVSAHH